MLSHPSACGTITLSSGVRLRLRRRAPSPARELEAALPATKASRTTQAAAPAPLASWAWLVIGLGISLVVGSLSAFAAAVVTRPVNAPDAFQPVLKVHAPATPSHQAAFEPAASTRQAALEPAASTRQEAFEPAAAAHTPTAAAVPTSCVLHGEAQPVVLTADMLNDDYCDCADGSDEPRTSACAGIVAAAARPFRCDAGFGSLGASRVGDGVCDCCDGSDEPAGACPDACGARREAAAREEAATRQGSARRREHEAAVAADPALLSAAPLDLRGAPALALLASRCYSPAEPSEYEYTFCLFRNATQAKSGRPTVSLGRRWAWADGGAPPIPASAAPPPHLACADASSRCDAWAQAGECTRNPGYMQASCRRACGLCPAAAAAPPPPPPADAARAPRLVGVLSGGDACGPHPPRSLRVEFACAEEERLGPVTEREICAYGATFFSPAACPLE